jgi:hypothetical protein
MDIVLVDDERATRGGGRGPAREASAASSSPRRASAATRQPSPASRSTSAAPMPELAPTTIAEPRFSLALNRSRSELAVLEGRHVLVAKQHNENDRRDDQHDRTDDPFPVLVQ